MKKGICILTAVLLLAGLAGCASGEASPEQMITVAAQETEASSEQTDRVIAFVFQEEQVIPGKELPAGVAAAAVESTQVTSCVAAGMETLYRYEGFDITVHNSTGSDPVYSVYFNSSDVSTAEGLSIGDSLDTVRDIYGEADSQGGFTWIYSDGNAELILLISEDAVVGIEYRMVS